MSDQQKKISKILQAFWDFECDICGDAIDEGEDFCYYDDQKICLNCVEDIKNEARNDS